MWGQGMGARTMAALLVGAAILGGVLALVDASIIVLIVVVVAYLVGAGLLVSRR